MSTGPLRRPAGEPLRPQLGRGAVPRLPRLVLLPSPPRKSRVPFALVVVLLIGSGLIGLLLLNTVLAQDAFALYQLRQKTAALSDQEQQLRQAVARAEAPAALASHAATLGMVPGGDPLFLRLPDGAVLGDPDLAQGSAPRSTARASVTPTPTPTPTPTASVSPSPSATASSSPRATKPATKPARPTAQPTARPTAGQR